MLNREQLRELFLADGTEQALLDAIEAGDLTQEAKERIEEFIACTDKDKAHELFDYILENDIEAKPSFEHANEALTGWKEIRDGLAQDVLAMQEARIETQGVIDTLEASIEQFAKNLSELYRTEVTDPEQQKQLDQEIADNLEGLRDSKAQLLVERDRLEKQTVSLEALSLMHAEAKHEVSQARGMVFAEATAPARQAVIDGWNSLGELGKKMTQAIGDAWQHHVNRHQAEKAAMKLDYDGIVGAIKHPIKYIEQKWHSAFAEHHCKEHNRAAEKIRKHEDKLLAMANKKIERENKSIEFRNKMAKLFGGTQQPLKEKFGRADMEKVEEFLKGKGITSLAAAYHKTMLEHAQKDFNHHKGHLDHHLGKIKEEMDRRQLEVQQLANEIKERAARGDFGRHTKTMDDVLRYMEEAQRSATAQTFSDNLAAYAKGHGFESAVEYNTKLNDAKVTLMQKGADHLPEPLQATWNEMAKGIDRMDQAMVLAVGIEAVRALDSHASIGAVQHNIVDTMIRNAGKNGIELDDKAKEAIIGVIEKFGGDKAPELCDKLREAWEQERNQQVVDHARDELLERAEAIIGADGAAMIDEMVQNAGFGNITTLNTALDAIEMMNNGAGMEEVAQMLEESDFTRGNFDRVDTVVDIIQQLDERGVALGEVVDFDRSEAEHTGPTHE